MIPFLLLVLLVAVLVVGYAYFHKRTEPKYLAVAEYWAYLPGEEMPGQDKLLDRVVGRNPYKQRGKAPIGPQEGIILSDVRLHIALVLRRKNPHVFRPDLYEDVEVTQQHLSMISASNSVVRLRYLSEEPLKDKRHLQFLIHAADAMAEIGGGQLVYDQVQQKLLTKPDLEEHLAAAVDATGAPLHVRSLWKETVADCHAETRGLKKVGLPEIRTGPMEKDQQIIVTQVLELAIEQLWTPLALPAEVAVELYGDQFKLLFGEIEDGFVNTRILRVHGG